MRRAAGPQLLDAPSRFDVVLHDDGVVHVVMAPMDARETAAVSVRWLGEESGSPYVVELRGELVSS